MNDRQKRGAAVAVAGGAILIWLLWPRWGSSGASSASTPPVPVRLPQSPVAIRWSRFAPDVLQANRALVSSPSRSVQIDTGSGNDRFWVELDQVLGQFAGESGTIVIEDPQGPDGTSIATQTLRRSVESIARKHFDELAWVPTNHLASRT